MVNIELYIDSILCDTGASFSVRLNRVLLQPSELNAKDAQYSYSITLPPTAVNRGAFNYSNIEETKNKFNRLYESQLIVNGVRVFKGNFRLTDISDSGYKGNLYTPAIKSVKDIFGDTKLNENSECRLPFTDYAEYITKYNTEAKRGPQIAIFPYVLYGVLPKYPADNGSRTVWDNRVRIGISDMPPSINPLLMLRQIFKSKGYGLSGTAFDDDRLTNLYMSYKNSPTYIQPWNYGYQARIKLRGCWSNVYNKREQNKSYLERGGFQASSDAGTVYACDLFDATNTHIDVIEDKGGNVLLRTEKDLNAQTWTKNQVYIPVSGFYKVRFNASLKVFSSDWYSWAGDTGILIIGGSGKGVINPMVSPAFPSGYAPGRAYGVRLLRDFGKGDFGIARSKINGVYYKNNLPQTERFNGDAFDSSTDVPKYFPKILPNGQLMFIDPAQDPNHLLGFEFGGNFVNPEDSTYKTAQMQVAKPAISWDSAAALDKPTRLAVSSPGYRRFGFDTSGDGDGNDPIDTEVLGWFDSDRFKITLNGAPSNYAKRGQYEGVAAAANWTGQGEINAVVWLEAGELLTVAAVSQEGKRNTGKYTRYGWVSQEVAFNLDITPFRVDSDWLKVGLNGNGKVAMEWGDPVSFDTDSINLVGFLPADIKTDDFIDNFCKAFNLQLSQEDAQTFRLDVKQTKTMTSKQYINLDNLISVKSRSNQPLDLPARFKLGFTVDQEEEGYVSTGDDGGGYFETGALEDKTVEQKNSFSYNWFKDIAKDSIRLSLPVISKREVWDAATPYAEAMRKRYTNQALRFWYFDGLLNDKGASFFFNGTPLSIACVSDTLPGRAILNYKDKPLTILGNFFTILVNSSSHYTEIEGYLSAVQYEQLNGSAMALFNSDLYYVAEVSAYDPTGRNKTKIKLIRKI